MKWRARISPKRLIIAGASARPFVRAAAGAGHHVIAVDAYADLDTRRHAGQVLSLPYADGGFAAAALRRQLFPLLEADTAFVYGSGFETQPQLLREIASRCLLLGNDADTVAHAKTPAHFFGLLAELGIAHPATVTTPPRPAGGWLAKRAGGSGGTHVRPATQPAAGDIYYQQQLAGIPCSLLFLADGRDAVAVGYNRQWLAPAPGMPFRYGGAVSQLRLPPALGAGMLDAARRLTARLGLRGLNSLDCMADGGQFRVLEINPRLSATFALYDAAHHGARLFAAHLDACRGRLAPGAWQGEARAHLIYYAPHPLTIPHQFTWPPWAADVPAPGSRIGQHEPLCSVLAAAGDADAAAALARARVSELNLKLTNLGNNNE